MYRLAPPIQRHEDRRVTTVNFTMKFFKPFAKRLARDWEEFLHDMMIYVTDYRREKPETRKIDSVMLIVCYLVISVLMLKIWVTMPPPG